MRDYVKQYPAKELPLYLRTLLLRVDAEVLADDRCYIVGGCLRDALHDVNFRDVDIVMLTDGTWSPSEVARYVEQICRKVGLTIRQQYANAPHYEAGELAHVAALYDQVGMRNVDLLFYNLPSIEKVLDKFDFNVNQYYYCFNWSDDVPLSSVTYSSNAGPERTLVQVAADVRFERVEYITAIARNLGWEV